MRNAVTTVMAIVFGAGVLVGAHTSTPAHRATFAKHGVPEDNPKGEKPQRPEKPGIVSTTLLAKHGVPEDNPKVEKPERPGDDHPKPGHTVQV